MQDNIAVLREWIAGSGNIVFFGGAGVSTESGIPDFRSTDGLYRQEYKYPPETILSHTFFEQNPEEFFRFYRAKLIPDKSVQPNAAHRRLAELEREGKLRAVITQNIDGCIRPRAASASLSCTVRSTAALRQMRQALSRGGRQHRSGRAALLVRRRAPPGGRAL